MLTGDDVGLQINLLIRSESKFQDFLGYSKMTIGHLVVSIKTKKESDWFLGTCC